jgi:ferredoxin
MNVKYKRNKRRPHTLAKFVVEIDKKICQGFGACVEICPSFFKLSEEDGKSTMLKDSKKIVEDGKLVKEVYETDDLGCAREGAEACPFKAIHVKDLERDVQLV